MIALGDAEQANHAQRYFKTGPGEYAHGDQWLGIRMPVVRQQVRTFRQITLDQTLSLLQSPWHEIRMLALLIMIDQYRRAKTTSARRAIYLAYLDQTGQINNWDLVDLSAPHIVGNYLLTRSDRPLFKLAESDHLWQRRIAIIATLAFIRKDRFDSTFALADWLLDDPHDLIHKAVGWMLREIGKRDLQAECQFLNTRYQNMPRTMLRYAIEKFPEPLRLGYLHGQI